MNRNSLSQLNRRRGTLASVLLVASAFAGSLLYWQWHRQPLPSPDTAAVEQLVRWLALHDIERVPNEQRLALVNRLESEFQKEDTPSTDTSWVPASWMSRLQTNISVLKRVWFFSRVDQYASCSHDRRLSFLRERLDVVAQWSAISARLNPEDPQTSDPSATLFGDIQRWLSSTEGSARIQAAEAVKDGVICWLACYDLHDQPLPVRTALAHRIVEQLERGQRTTQISLPLDEDQHDQLVENSKLLMESWTIELSKEFGELPIHQRDEFVDHLLTKIDNWGLKQLLFPSASEQENATSQRFMQTVNSWVDRADNQDRPGLRDLVAHVQYRMLVQQLRRWLPRDQRA